MGPHFREDLLLNTTHAYQMVTDWHKKTPCAGIKNGKKHFIFNGCPLRAAFLLSASKAWRNTKTIKRLWFEKNPFAFSLFLLTKLHDAITMDHLKNMGTCSEIKYNKTYVLKQCLSWEKKP